MNRALRLSIALAVVFTVTAVLWTAKVALLGPAHPVFLYLLPLALVAIVYGSLPALFCVFVAIICADYFLYDPLYSFGFGSSVETGDLVCFAVVAVMGVKCVSELLRPATKPVAARMRYRAADNRAEIKTALPVDQAP